MSEYQYVGFRAVDGPVQEKDLEFMHRQSSRAEITPWSFDNEYHYGGFRGDAAEMLRRGYDVHLHYANFGTRRLMIRLPAGLPDPTAAEPYWDEESLYFLKDEKGPGGILCVEPFYEPGDLEEIWDADELLSRLLPLRGEILDGDLRPLYLARLGVALDYNHDPEEENDPPVPAGLDRLTGAQHALAELYGLGDSLIAAAAQGAPSLPDSASPENRYTGWIQRQPEATKNAWLARLMAEPHSTVRRELLAEFQKSENAPAWPTARIDRTVADLLNAAEEIQRETNRKKSEAAARKRAKKLADMAADPERTLRETEQLVEQRNTRAYQKVAEQLADLRQALAGGPQAGLAEQYALKLKDANPTLHHLTSALRKKGFVKKK